jgi:cytidyltransferase-like protein
VIRVIVSGYFNPLHGGHLDMFEEAKVMGDHLIVIVNNDVQQLLKKGKIILPEENRVRLIKALKGVDEVILSVDKDPTQIRTLSLLAATYRHDNLIFANGGDRDSEKAIPEGEVAREYGIKLAFGIGGTKKADSSTRIYSALV